MFCKGSHVSCMSPLPVPPVRGRKFFWREVCSHLHPFLPLLRPWKKIWGLLLGFLSSPSTLEAPWAELEGASPCLGEEQGFSSPKRFSSSPYKSLCLTSAESKPGSISAHQISARSTVQRAQGSGRSDSRGHRSLSKSLVAHIPHLSVHLGRFTSMYISWLLQVLCLLALLHVSYIYSCKCQFSMYNIRNAKQMASLSSASSLG